MIESNKYIKNLPTSCRNSIANFISNWNKNKNFLGALLVGSYATGLNNDRSDLDIIIILNNKVRSWKRSNIRDGKFLIEYGIYPINYLKELQDRDIKDSKRLRTRMLATGKIIADNSGVIKKLQKENKKLLKLKLPKPSKEEVELYEYTLWDQLDNLLYLHTTKSPGFSYAYYSGLQNIIKYYANFLKLEIPRPNNMFRFLVSNEFCDKYCIEPFPDKKFRELFIQSLNKPSINKFEELTEYTQKQLGGFSIHGWKLSGKTKQAIQKK